MNRRSFLVAGAAVALAWPRGVGAQQAGRTYRIGFLSSFPLPLFRTPLRDVFENGFRELGYSPGVNLVIEPRAPLGWSNQDERLRALAAELLSMRVEVIIAAWNPAIAALKRAAATIPVVMVGVVDPVGHGLSPACRGRYLLPAVCTRNWVRSSRTVSTSAHSFGRLPPTSTGSSKAPSQVTYR